MTRLLLAGALVLMGLQFMQAADNWPDFRGPSGEGSSDATSLPLRWSEGQNVRWKTALPGRGFSSPVVYKDQIWLTTAVVKPLSAEEMKRRLAGQNLASQKFVPDSVSLWAICVDKNSGKLLRRIKIFVHDKPDSIHKTNSYASPSCVIEAGRVYCHFGTFGTACLDTSSGEILWKRRLKILHSVGPGSSPILYKNLLVIPCDGTDTQYVAALDKQSGKTVWKTDRPPMDTNNGEHKKAFSTPLVVRVAGRDQIVIPGAQWGIAYDPLTGDEIWRVRYGKGFSNVPRPVTSDGLVFVCTGFMVSELWAIRTGGRGDISSSHVAWKTRRQVPTRPSPVVVGDELYMISDRGVATCFDAKTGKAHWTKRIPGNYSSSPLFANSRIYFFNHEGKATVIRPGRKYTELAVNQLDGGFRASPAISAGALFLRTDKHLYRIEDARMRQARRP